jgi:hypothetical protein
MATDRMVNGLAGIAFIVLMRTRRAALFGLLAFAAASASQAADHKRDPYQRAAFAKAHPCPATGKARGACPGYVVDHIKPLCAGGVDRPSNMQWQTVKEAKIKDRLEARECSRIRKTARAPVRTRSGGYLGT